MKKIFLICLAAVFMITLGSGLALADYTQTFMDKTLVQESTDGWMDVVGSVAHYDIIRTDVTWSGSDVIFKIHTNDPGTPAFAGDYIADLAIDKDRNGIWETGIILSLNAHGGGTMTRGPAGNPPSQAGNPGDVFTLASATDNSHWTITNDPPFNYGGYGLYYDTSNNPVPGGSHVAADVPVLLKPNANYSVFNGTVTWGADPDLIAANLVTITLTGINSTGDWDHFDFLWGSETCGNDVQFDHADVPLPPSMLLLGTGLLGLVGWRARKIKDGPAVG